MVAMIAQSTPRIPGLVGALCVIALVSACGSAPQPRMPAEAAAVSPSAGHAAGIGTRAANIAVQQVGVPYRYGGQGPSGFDCSGLVHYSYRHAGMSVPRTTGQLWEATEPVARSDLSPGDVLFFSIEGKMQHVGLYIGDGRFVHAPTSGREVSIASLRSGFYRQAFLRAGRPR